MSSCKNNKIILICHIRHEFSSLNIYCTSALLSEGYGVPPLGLHVGQIGLIFSTENVLTTALSTGRRPPPPVGCNGEEDELGTLRRSPLLEVPLLPITWKIEGLSYQKSEENYPFVKQLASIRVWVRLEAISMSFTILSSRNLVFLRQSLLVLGFGFESRPL